MKCVATPDKPSYACETTSLQFNAIPMYQSLRATFRVENTSTIPLPYKMLMTNDGSPMTAASQRRPQTGGAIYEPIPCPFEIEPEEGSVAPSSSGAVSPPASSSTTVTLSTGADGGGGGVAAPSRLSSSSSSSSSSSNCVGVSTRGASSNATAAAHAALVSE